MPDSTDVPVVERVLFAYGTLLPADPIAEGWETDAVRGRLYHLGPYPGLIDLGEPGAGWVEGFVRVLRHEELIRRLDPYEGVDDGLFRREAVTTRQGRPAWVYTYARPLPAGALGPIVRWERSPESWSPEGTV